MWLIQSSTIPEFECIGLYFFSSVAAVGDTVFLANDAHEAAGGAAAKGTKAADAVAVAVAGGVDPDLSACCLPDGDGLGLGSALPLWGDVGADDTSPFEAAVVDGLLPSPAGEVAAAAATTGLGFCTTGLLAFSATMDAAVRLAPPHGVAVDERVDATVVVVEEGTEAEEEEEVEARVEEVTASDPSARG